ncbi:MAG TPA: tetratricopeptide repeat protein, partial [Roseiflexaceae bacterium]|nr:tetratricopeptide repeat protein [Roseiflexaceae bacterium]
LLATVQEFARELLAASGSTGVVRRRHALYMLELAEAAEPHLIGPQQGEWRRLLMVEHDNMVAALKWSLAESSDSIIGLRISMALLWYWKPLGYRREGLTWLEAALARCSDCAPGVRAHALHGAGTLAGRLLDYALAERRLEEALTLSRTLGDVSGILDTLLQLCAFTREQGSYERARALADESLTLARQHRRLDVVVASLLELGNIALAQGDYGRALTCYDAALPDARQSGNMQTIGWIVANMGRVALEQGATQQAEELYQESSDLFERAGLLDSLAWMGYELGRVALQRGEVDQAAQRFVSALEQAQTMGLALLMACALEGLAALRSSRWPLHAARLLGAASQIRSDIANPPTCAEQAQQVRISAQLHRMLDAPGFAAAWQSGRQLSWEQAVEEAHVQV